MAFENGEYGLVLVGCESHLLQKPFPAKCSQQTCLLLLKVGLLTSVYKKQITAKFAILVSKLKSDWTKWRQGITLLLINTVLCCI